MPRVGSIYTQPPHLTNVIVSATVVVCTCLTSLIYSIVVLLLIVTKYSVHSVVVWGQDVGTHSSVHTRECMCTVVLEYMYSSVLVRVLPYITHCKRLQNLLPAV